MLATNIGRNCFRENIGQEEREEMLIHILANDDWESSLFKRTMVQIWRFGRGREKFKGNKGEEVCHNHPSTDKSDGKADMAHLTAHVDDLPLQRDEVSSFLKTIPSLSQTR